MIEFQEVLLPYVQFGRMIFEGGRMRIVLVFGSGYVKPIREEWRE